MAEAVLLILIVPFLGSLAYIIKELRNLSEDLRVHMAEGVVLEKARAELLALKFDNVRTAIANLEKRVSEAFSHAAHAS